MRGVVLPGDSTVRYVDLDVPEPGPGQVLLAVKASSICGSDIRAIYREHLIGCTSPYRAAYGWQRDGGHAEYLLAEERTCLPLPDELSFLDGALVSCGFGTAYQALLRLAVSGRDRLLVTGLGPVGLAAAMLGRALGAGPVIGTDIAPQRLALAVELGLVDYAVPANEDAAAAIADLTGGRGCEATVDCSGNAAARLLALRSTRTWGRCAFVGEGGRVTLDVSQELIHRQITLHGSWVTSLRHMSELLENLARWRLRPDVTVTHRFPLDEADEAYRLAAEATTGKVAIVTP
jgi:threonine dehydrogenase-like Zn-dependent dehydrogenase